MQELRQTKESFIKSMLLFFVLLVICFAPFFAFAQTPAFNSKNTGLLAFQVSKQNNLITLSFTSGFQCAAYTVEGRTEEGVYQPLFYCREASLCMDARNSITHTFGFFEYPYTHYRVQTTMLSGEVVYSGEVKPEDEVPFSVQVVQTSVSDHIKLLADGTNSFAYQVNNMNGEEMISGKAAQAEFMLDVASLPPGMYILTFRDDAGNCRHEKYFRSGL